MEYIYFTEFYKKICDSLSKYTGMSSQAISLSGICETDMVRIKEYLNEIISSKWEESGALIIRNRIVSQILKNVTKLSTFIRDNLASAADISVNSLLPELKMMKEKDELLCKNKERLETMKSSLTTLRNNMPSKYSTNEDGIKSIRKEYNNAVSKINGLIQEINDLSKIITDQVNALNVIKKAVDDYITKIIALGEEDVVIPAFSLPSNLSGLEIPLMEPGFIDYSNPANVSENSYFDETTGIYYEVIANRDIRVVLPDGREFIQYSQSTGRSNVKNSNHGPVCGPCSYASMLSFFGYSSFSPEAVGFAVKQFSSFSALNNLINRGYKIADENKNRYYLSSTGVGGNSPKTLMLNPTQNEDLDIYIKKQADLQDKTYKEVQSSAKRSYLEERITETLEQGGVVTVRTSATQSKKALSFTKGGHFVTIMGIDKSGHLIISNSTATSIASGNSGSVLRDFTKEVKFSNFSYRIPQVTLEEFINNNIMGGKPGNSITCITGIQAEPIIMQADNSNTL